MNNKKEKLVLKFNINWSISKSTVLIVASGVVLFVLLQEIYERIVAPVYSSSGFYCSFSINRCVIAWCLYTIALIVMCIANKKRSVSWLIFETIIIIAFAPGLILYMYRDTAFFDLYIIYYAIMLIAMIVIKPIRFRFTSKYQKAVFRLLAVITGFTILFIWVRYTNCHIQISLLDVYSQRAEAAGYDIPQLLKYIYAMTKSVIPLLIVYYLDKGWKKNLLIIVYYVLLQYISFCIDASKGTVFLAALSIVGYIVVKNVKCYEKWIPFVFVIVALGGIVEKIITDNYYIIAVFIRRVMFVPANLNYDYYSFFQIEEFDYFRSGILKLFEQSPYNSVGGIPKAIGIFNGSGSSENNGLFSDAYSNLGVIGIIIMPILVVLAFKLIEGAAQGLDNKVMIPLIIMVAIVFVSSSFFTNLLTHGVLLCTMLLYCLPRKSNCKSNISS